MGRKALWAKWSEKHRPDKWAKRQPNWGYAKPELKCPEVIFEAAGEKVLLRQIKYKPAPINQIKPDFVLESRRHLSDALRGSGCSIGGVVEGKCYVLKSDTGSGKTFLMRSTLDGIAPAEGLSFLSIVSRRCLADEQHRVFNEHLGHWDLEHYQYNTGIEQGDSFITTIDSLMH